jgi:hypothetical protein
MNRRQSPKYDTIEFGAKRQVLQLTHCQHYPYLWPPTIEPNSTLVSHLLKIHQCLRDKVVLHYLYYLGRQALQGAWASSKGVAGCERQAFEVGLLRGAVALCE